MLMFLVLLLFMLFPDKTAACTKDVLTVWYTAVVPSLLPFFIVCKLLNVTGEANRAAAKLAPLFRFLCLPEALAYPFMMSLLCGTPTRSRVLSTCPVPKTEIDGFAAVCCCPGPLFVIGTVGVGMFGSAAIGYEIWSVCVCTCVLMLFCYPFPAVSFCPACTDGSAAEAIWDSLRAILTVAGYMLLFSLPADILLSFFSDCPPLIAGLFKGLCEFTGGIRLLARSSGAVPLIAFLLSFGGGSVIFQCLSFLPEVRIGKFIGMRLLAGLLSLLLCFLAEKTAWFVPGMITLSVILLQTVRRRKASKLLIKKERRVTY